MEFETVIGLEIHAQMKTLSKIFCGCSTEFGAPPNTHTCPVCLGMPGSLPVLNRQVVESAIKLGLATGSTLNRENRFARKNYFYPDLPKGYQISQFELPICEHGRVEIEVDGRSRTIGITRIHMEEDAGKLVHDEREPVSYVDLNRTGTPLLEIVSEPDLRSPTEAAAYLRKLHAIVRYLDICDGNMQEGSFRCDANISLRPKGQDKLGTRTELKNMNSFRNVQLALEYEERRQRDLLLDGGEVVQQTLLWDPDRGRTEPMRGKEEAHDYRYFPDPDLVPVVVDEAWIERVRAGLPELPDARRQRFAAGFDLPAEAADLLTGSRELADYFEAVNAVCGDAKLAANWVMGELSSLLNSSNLEIEQSPVSAAQLGGMILRIKDNTISGKIAKMVFEAMANGEGSADQVIEAKGLKQVTDSGAIESMLDEVLAANAEQVEQYRASDEAKRGKMFGFFVGQAMKAAKGKANPGQVNELLKKKLEN